MRGLKPIPTKMEEPLLQELLQIAHSEAPRELGSSNLPLLSQPLSQWKNPVNYIPAVPSECVRTAEKSYLDRPYSTHWEDELLLQASQAFSNQQEEEEDSLLLAASQDYEKRCGPLMTSDDVQSAVTVQVPLNTKRNNNWAANTWQAWAIGRNKSPHCHKSLRLINNLSTCGQVNMIFIDPTTSKETPTHSCVRWNNQRLSQHRMLSGPCSGLLPFVV